MQSRSISAWAVLWLCVVAGVQGVRGAVLPENRPNILLLVADDLGFSDLGCYGGEIRTPHLDALAAGGVRFTQFYNTGRCWPTRAAVLTGYYPQAIRRDVLPEVADGKLGARPGWAKLLPRYLRDAGYRSYHSGKWHVDGAPLSEGFDRSYSLEDHDRHFGPKDHRLDGVKLPPVGSGVDYYSTTAIADYAIEFLKGHEREHSKRPFFQYVAFTAPHFPLQAPARDVEVYGDRYRVGWDAIRRDRHRAIRQMGLVKGPLPGLEEDVIPAWNLSEADLGRRVGAGEVGVALPWVRLSVEQQRFQAQKMAVHAAMVDRMDAEIGRILAQVRTMGCWSNTVVLFLSDNGASAEQIIRGDGHEVGVRVGTAGTFLGLGPGWSSAANTPLRKHKSWVHEGGIATPLIVHWPERLRDGGGWRRTPGHVVDLVPTLLDWVGVSESAKRVMDAPGVPAWHGRSLADLTLTGGEATAPVRALWWNHEKHRALRLGDWKLVSSYDSLQKTNGAWELYRIATDRQELRDRARQNPDRVESMAREWDRMRTRWVDLAR